MSVDVVRLWNRMLHKSTKRTKRPEKPKSLYRLHQSWWLNTKCWVSCAPFLCNSTYSVPHLPPAGYGEKRMALGNSVSCHDTRSLCGSYWEQLGLENRIQYVYHEHGKSKPPSLSQQNSCRLLRSAFRTSIIFMLHSFKRMSPVPLEKPRHRFKDLHHTKHAAKKSFLKKAGPRNRQK